MAWFNTYINVVYYAVPEYLLLFFKYLLCIYSKFPQSAAVILTPHWTPAARRLVTATASPITAVHHVTSVLPVTTVTPAAHVSPTRCFPSLSGRLEVERRPKLISLQIRQSMPINRWRRLMANAFVAACQCSAEGSRYTSCDQETGQCVCLPHVVGLRCDGCAHGAYGFPYCEGSNAWAPTQRVNRLF